MSRKQAREIALHLIFEMSFQDLEPEEVVAARLEQSIMQSISGDIALYAGKLSRSQTAYITEVVKGVSVRRDELDDIIQLYSKGWKLSRLSRITIAMLRLALYEMRYVEDVPVGAAINEAVELAKQYDTEDAAAFINGILGSAARAEDGEQAAAPIPDDKIFEDETAEVQPGLPPETVTDETVHRD